MSIIDQYDEGLATDKDVRDFAIKMDTELIAIGKALDEFRGFQETNIMVIRRLRKFYTHDRERYTTRLADLFASVNELQSYAEKFKEDFDAICDQILSG